MLFHLQDTFSSIDPLKSIDKKMMLLREHHFFINRPYLALIGPTRVIMFQILNKNFEKISLAYLVTLQILKALE